MQIGMRGGDCDIVTRVEKQNKSMLDVSISIPLPKKAEQDM